MLIYVLLINVFFLQNGELKMGEVVRQSGNVLIIQPCDNRDPLHQSRVNKRDTEQVDMTCREFLRGKWK